ncbi:MAG: hypothetical protein ACRC80_22465 [Waterburya sp.]
MVTGSLIHTISSSKFKSYLIYQSSYAQAIVEIREPSNGKFYIDYRHAQIDFCHFNAPDNNSSCREKIADFICNSTTDYSEEINTQDRLILWLEHKDYIYRLASCFLNRKKLLKEEYNNGGITKSVLQIMEKYYETYYSLFKIIDHKWEKIRNNFKNNKNFLFNSSLELFQEIIKSFIDDEYKKFLEPQIQLKAKENISVYKLYKEVSSYNFLEELTPIEEKTRLRKIRKLRNFTRPNQHTKYWYKEIIDFFILEAQKDQDIKNYILSRNKLASNIFEIIENRKFKKPANYIMRSGVLYKSSDWQSAEGKICKARRNNKTK